MNPILFLDIDGVINPFKRLKDVPVDANLTKRLAMERNDPSIEDLNIYLAHMVQYRFDWNSIQYIEKLIHEFDAKIVISSSWRMMYEDKDFEGMFSIMNWKGAYIGKLESFKPRYTLIKDYIKENNVQAYLVLDDMDMSSYFPKQMVLTHNSLNENNYVEARKLLKAQMGV